MTRPGDKYMVPVGKFLGQMTDEIKQYGPRARIVEFVSTGAKSYGIKIEKENGDFIEIVKSKGFTLSYAISKHINMGKMIDFVKKKCIEGVTTEEFVFSRGIRTQRNHEITTNPIRKTFKVTANKRIVIPGDTFETYPFGFCMVY